MKSVKSRAITLLLFCSALPGTAQPAASYMEDAGWHKNYSTERQGANVQAALDLLKQRGMKPSGPVVVGIIDSGIGTPMNGPTAATTTRTATPMTSTAGTSSVRRTERST